MGLNPYHLRRFRRRTWAVVATCIAFRASAALAGFDPADPATALISTCTSSPENLSC